MFDGLEITHSTPLVEDELRDILRRVAESTVPVKLVLNSCRIEEAGGMVVGELMAECRHLVHLDLRGNRIGVAGSKAVAEGMAGCPDLEHLDLRHNAIDAEGCVAIGAGMAKCPRLRHLQLQQNAIQDIGAVAVGKGMQKCPELQHLDLSVCALGDQGAQAIGEGMMHCPELLHLDLSSVGTLMIPPKRVIGDEGGKSVAAAMSGCPKLQFLGLRGNRLGSRAVEEICEAMSMCPDLRHLDLGMNKLGVLGGLAVGGALSKRKCPSLECLDLARNALGPSGARAIGKGMAKAPKLRKIMLERNDIGDNGIIEIGGGISHLEHLEHLGLEANAIGDEGVAVICDAAAARSTLTVLLLSENDFTTLPPSICSLPLEKLHIDLNQLETLPAGFLRLRASLAQIETSDNPWVTPPKEVMETNDTSKIFAFLEALDKEGGLVCRQSRLLLIGLGEAGKTSLQRALVSKSDATGRIAADDRTVGIDITAWRPDPADDFEYRVWDFAGQRIYYGTHQFFLSTRVQYVLVWSLAAVANGTQDVRTSVQEWLDALSARVSGASVVLVATHADEVDADKAAELVQATQAFVAEYVAARGTGALQIAQDGASFVVSSTTGAGIGDARAAIVAAGQALPHVGEVIPTSWVAVRDVLRDMDAAAAKHGKAPVATMAEVVAAGTTDRMPGESVREAVSLWHELGEVFVHGDLVVLRPQWVVDVLKALVAHELSSNVRDAHPAAMAMLEHEGRLSWALAQELLAGAAPRALHRELMAILGEFDVVIDVGTDGEAPEWIVPVLLPAGEWDPARETDWPLWAEGETTGHSGQVAYRFMPAGLFHRLCVRAHSALAWATEDYHATFARFRSADGTRLFVELGEDGGGRQLVSVHGRGAQSWAATQTVLKAARSLSEDFFRGVQCEVSRPGSADPTPWDRLTEDRFRVDVDVAEADTAAAITTTNNKPVMLSYKHREREGELALQIHKGLEAGGTPVWIDVEGIVGGSTWRQAISAGIQGARVVVFALSGRSVVSPFCEEEICLAARLGKPVIPALVSAAPSRADYRPQMLRLRDTQWVDFHGQDFAAALKELQARVTATLASAPSKDTRGTGARVEVPECPAGDRDGAGTGRVFIAHSPSDEDAAAAEAIQAWMERRAGAAACSILGDGERVESAIRKQDLDRSQVVIAVVSRAFVADEDCWKQLSDWDEAHGTAGTASLVPVFVEDLGAGWEGQAHTQALELVVSRHSDLATDLSKARDTGRAMEALCSKVTRLVETVRDKDPLRAAGHTGGHASTTSASNGGDLAERAEQAEQRARLAEARADTLATALQQAEERAQRAETQLAELQRKPGACASCLLM